MCSVSWERPARRSPYIPEALALAGPDRRLAGGISAGSNPRNWFQSLRALVRAVSGALPCEMRVWASVASSAEKGVRTTVARARSPAGRSVVIDSPVVKVTVAPLAMSMVDPPVRVKLIGPPEGSNRLLIEKLPFRSVVTVPRGRSEPSDWVLPDRYRSPDDGTVEGRSGGGEEGRAVQSFRCLGEGEGRSLATSEKKQKGAGQEQADNSGTPEASGRRDFGHCGARG